MNDFDLTKQLLYGEPASVMLVGNPVFRLRAALDSHFAEQPDGSPTPQVTACNSLDQLIDSKTGASQPCALCLHLPNNTDDADKLLGMACRISPNLVLVEHSNSVPDAQLLDDRHFFAFGFRRIGQRTSDSGLQQHWYGYRLRDYKQPPDWLNARFWAHPERFDLQE